MRATQLANKKKKKLSKERFITKKRHKGILPAWTLAPADSWDQLALHNQKCFLFHLEVGAVEVLIIKRKMN